MGSINRRNGGRALQGLTFLVVEDDFLLLADLEEVLQDAGADKVHSCRTIGEALALLDQGCVSAAVLDVRVGQDSIEPVARGLARGGIPFIFYTGQISTDHIVAEWADRPILSKPARSYAIVRTLADLLQDEAKVPQHGVLAD